MTKIPLAGLFPEELVHALQLSRAFRGKQLFQWIQKSAQTWDEMTDLPHSLLAKLADKAVLSSSGIESVYTEEGISHKVRIKLSDGYCIESVLLVDDQGRKTACLSSQVGCAMGCAFCKTGSMGLKRDLFAYEIVEQFLLLCSSYGDISHIVFMGMGEPLLNLREVSKAIEIFHHPLGKYIGARKMTLSTCGIVPGIRELAGMEIRPRLAVSLVTAKEETREKLMLVTRSSPLSLLKKVLGEYQQKSTKRITLEIILLKGITDTDADVKALVSFVPPLHVSINLIPWNPAPGLPCKHIPGLGVKNSPGHIFQRPEGNRILWFKKRLEDAGFTVTQRYQKGDSIHAACGQLFVDED
jgi:23S rRNA (adenine2503-C2)-methyltransferase